MNEWMNELKNTKENWFWEGYPFSIEFILMDNLISMFIKFSHVAVLSQTKYVWLILLFLIFSLVA